MPKGYWIVHIKVTDPAPYPDYVRKAQPVIEAFGGVYLVRGGESDVTEGEARPRHVVVAFPDLATARACYRSPEYQDAAAIRLSCAETDFTIVEGYA